MLAACDTKHDESITIYDCLQGKQVKTVYSKKYGLGAGGCTRFAQSSAMEIGATVLHSSTREDDVIRYLSLHDNQYLRYFKGHKSRVVSMDTC